jgi:hypothetical protein
LNPGKPQGFGWEVIPKASLGCLAQLVHAHVVVPGHVIVCDLAVHAQQERESAHALRDSGTPRALVATNRALGALENPSH